MLPLLFCYLLLTILLLLVYILFAVHIYENNTMKKSQTNTSLFENNPRSPFPIQQTTKCILPDIAFNGHFKFYLFNFSIFSPLYNTYMHRYKHRYVCWNSNFRNEIYDKWNVLNRNVWVTPTATSATATWKTSTTIQQQ